MKKWVLVAFLAIIFISCRNKNTVKYLNENYTTQELQILLKIKIDTQEIKSINGNSKLVEEAQDFDLFTIKQALEAVYGPDNRKDICSDVNSAFKIRNSSGVFLFSIESQLKRNTPHEFELTRKVFKDAHHICKNERFRNQSVVKPVYGTAFAIDSNLVVTTAHNLLEEFVCNTDMIRLVSGYKLDSGVVKKNQIFTVDSIVSLSLSSRREEDFAIMRTKEKIPQEMSLRLSKSEVSNDSQLYIIGHPMGLSLKIADSARVIVNNMNSNFFRADLDAFKGNSGSPVFDEKTNEVKGMLVSGVKDYHMCTLECCISNICGIDDCKGEKILRISVLFEELNKLKS